MDPIWVFSNLDRIGAYALLVAGIWALITGRLITAGRLDDHKEMIRLLREENAQHRATAEATAAAMREIVGQMTGINRVLEALADDPPPRRGRGT